MWARLVSPEASLLDCQCLLLPMSLPGCPSVRVRVLIASYKDTCHIGLGLSLPMASFYFNHPWKDLIFKCIGIEVLEVGTAR